MILPLLILSLFLLSGGQGRAQAVSTGPNGGQEEGAVARGAYLVRAAGCKGCHSDAAGGGEDFAGGRALKTPFGTFYTPNLTPDRESGIGGWEDADFLAALQRGVAPDGSHYYPAFPYTSYTGMSDEDALAIKAYLFSLAPVSKPNRVHDLKWPFSMRFLLVGWKGLFFREGRFREDPAKSGHVNRGAYLATALGHCGECHTPRNFLGAVQEDMALAGNAEGPDRELVPNITPDMETGIGKWSRNDLIRMMRSGFKPGLDDLQGSMEEVVEEGLKHLSRADQAAIADYLRSLAPIRNKVSKRAE